MSPVLGQYLIELLDRYPGFRARVMPCFKEFIGHVPWESEAEAATATRRGEKWKAMRLPEWITGGSGEAEHVRTGFAASALLPFTLR